GGSAGQSIGTLEECRERVVSVLTSDDTAKTASDRLGLTASDLQGWVDAACERADADATVGDVADEVRDGVRGDIAREDAASRRRQAARERRAQAKALVFQLREEHGDQQFRELCWTIAEVGPEYAREEWVASIDAPPALAADIFDAGRALCPEVGRSRPVG